MKEAHHISDLSSHLFWDVNRDNLSFDKSAQYLIERVASLGDLKDWQLIRAVYGDEKIKGVILNMRYLDEKSLHFYSLVYGIPQEDFRCYKLKLLGGRPFPF